MAIAVRETAQFPPFYDLSYPLKKLPSIFHARIEQIHNFFTVPRNLFETYEAVDQLVETCRALQPYSLAEGIPRLSQQYRDMVRLQNIAGINKQVMADAIDEHVTHMVGSVAVARSILLQQENITASCKSIGADHHDIFKTAREIYTQENLDDVTFRGIQLRILARCKEISRIYRSDMQPYYPQIQAIMLKRLKSNGNYLDGDLHDEHDLYFDAVEEFLAINVPID